MLRSPPFGRWLGLSSMALALGVASGLLEPAGVPIVGVINAISYLAWAAWLVVVGGVLLRRRPVAVAAERVTVSAHERERLVAEPIMR